MLDRLDEARAAAYAAADEALLAAVWSPGATALAQDAAALRELAARGQLAVGVRHRVVSWRVLDVTADRVRLRVVDVLGPHQVRDTGGAVVRRVAARAEAAYGVVLVRVDGDWRLSSVTQAV